MQKGYYYYYFFFAFEDFKLSSQIGRDKVTVFFEGISTLDAFLLCFHEYGDYKECCFIFK